MIKPLMNLGGNSFRRLQTELISPASTDVEVTSSSSRIEACPGESVSAEFIITNYGPQTTITIAVADDMDFLTSPKVSKYVLELGN